MLGLRQSVDSLEHMNQQMAQAATTFMLNQPQPADEGEMVVASADQKGIVMRRRADDPPPKCIGPKGTRRVRNAWPRWPRCTRWIVLSVSVGK